MKTAPCLLSTLLITSALVGQGPVYVRGTAVGGNNGMSWTDAYTDLEVALNATTTGEIWIAEGTYVPSSASSSFVLRSDVAIYGGFAGTETLREQRDPAAHVTVLSGDLNGDDQPGGFNRGDNAVHVVTGTGLGPATLLDGVTVRGGEAISNSSGGGIALTDANLILVGCRVTDNRASWGGGISTYSSGRLELTRCTLDDNYVHLYRGGAIHLAQGTDAVLVDCDISRNTIRSGVTHGNGAGIYGDPGTTLELRRCRMTSNIVDFVFGGTGYAPSGGAITFLGSSMVLDRCRFESNRAPAGGAIYTYGPMTATSCVFAGNRAIKAFDIGGQGGAIVNAFNAVSTMFNCVLYANTASEDGGGVFGNGTITLVDSIAWASSDGNGRVSESQVKSTQQRFCCIENFLTPRPGEDPIDPLKFPGCILDDPQFVGAVSGDFRLLPTSPCIETGDPTSIPVGRDLGGHPRRLDGDLDGVIRIDMGAHEFGHVHLDLATPVPGQLDLVLTGTDGLPVTLLVGGPSATGYPIPLAGELYLDVLLPIFAVPLGVLPQNLSVMYPGGSYDLAFQAIVLGGAGGNLSNAETLSVR
jgi:hypothetical protein